MYYLHHYFDPDFSHMHLAPEQGAGGSANQRYLGYVQNVVAGQVLAEMIDLEVFPDIPRDPRFTYQERYLPVGPNCALHPENQDKIIARANGYCFYHKGLINVKKLLNVRGHLGFRTGSIFFVGDMAVHGDIQTGFSAMARNLLVRGHIESAKVKAAGDIVCTAGVKGTNTSAIEEEPTGKIVYEPVPDTLLDCGGSIRLPFCEHAQLRARGNVIIDGHCLHSTLYVGGNLIIKGRLQGGATYANSIVYVEGQLGSDYTTATRICMGYDPFGFLALQKLENQIRYLKDKFLYFEKQSARNQVMEQEFRPRIDLVRRKLKIAHARRNDLWRKFAEDEQNAGKCRVIAPGKIMAGTEISIGRAFMDIAADSANQAFLLGENEIISRSPAVPHGREDQAGAWMT
ncbi:MAG: FapA family protein [Desulfovibrio sp.]|jgi:uncharacterized protein (DUF342 family)|nr:FapA family protein [Desulfovibrio sp.]